MSYQKIAKELGVSKQTLISWSKELQYEIANLKAIELETLQEQFYMQKEKRIQLFGEKLEAIKNELDKRDLSEIPTEKLFNLFIKLVTNLKREETETIFQGIVDFVDFATVDTWKVNAQK